MQLKFVMLPVAVIFVLLMLSPSLADTSSGHSDLSVRFFADTLSGGECVRCSFKDGKIVMNKGERVSCFTLPEVSTPFFAAELIPSWTVPAPAGSSYCVLARVGNESGMSPWLLMGEFGRDETVKSLEKNLEYLGMHDKFTSLLKNEYAVVKCDYLVFKKKVNRIQLRFLLFSSDEAAPEISSVTYAVSNCRGDLGLDIYENSKFDGQTAELNVPFRSQGWEHESISGHICSIVSTASIMEYYGVYVKTADLASLAYDKRNDMYGMWWRAVAAASQYGFSGWVQYFRSWSDVSEFISQGMPVAACIYFGNGELTGSATDESDGHVIVIAGFDKNGDVICLDGAFRSKEDGIVVYSRKELAKAWFKNGGGVGYVIFMNK